ncbi:Long-chain-fatty-acid--CoA ligase [Saccharolobus shibatae B12]|uniref:Long-chain-fatty-acid--CoA ligase n=1 Tax=Saccharolobus shibatae (strain ATCC 51178 / DSM 5389 / JCM 8931 / NBRC 15437 / B12) TaxID=523848 RepID=A0A8F5BQ32_SACSH|nr:long-chain fatty acid--CoA ligase [Saccharolobus shibatae]QXJ29390.1 Long-chain-fatty-acid--CoA ligase [Saccharolobus shibatae B12]
MGKVFIKGLPSTMMDDFQLDVINLLQHAAENYGEREVKSRKIDGTLERYNYRIIYERVKKLANALETLGVKPMDRVGALGYNTHRYFELYFGISGIGAVMVEMNFRLSPEELSYIAKHSKITVVFTDEQLLPIVEKVNDRIGLEKVVVMTDKESTPSTKISKVYHYEDLLSNSSPNYEFPIIDEKSACFACYTSGTTGMPKGVYYSHRAIVLHTMAVIQSLPINTNDALLQLVPMFHANGWGWPFTATMVGAKQVFPGIYSIDNLKPIVDLLINENITVSNGVPTLWIAIHNYLSSLKERPKFANLRVLIGGSEPPLSLIKGLREFGIEVIHGYGSTETTPLSHINVVKYYLGLSQEEYEEMKSKQGIPVFPIQRRIITPDGKDVPWDNRTVGELLERGPWVVKEYYKDPRTFDSFIGEGYDLWWKSGNAVTIDQYGYIKIVDRLKDLIKSGGEWISSVDMENYLMAYPKVLEATVVGVPHPKWQERPLAFIVVKPEYKGNITKEEILEHLSKKFPKWQLPEIIFTDSVPKTSTGKFDKKVLREQYKEYFIKTVKEL